MIANSQPFLLGVNYWPRRKAMYWWKEFDAEEVRDEFTEIARWKLDLVRIMLMWEDFQPESSRMSSSALANLGTVLNIAKDLDLKVIPTLFIGHMSGINWIPRWALTNNFFQGTRTPLWTNYGPTNLCLGNLYEDPFLLKAQQFGAEQIVQAYADHPSIYAWNITNEHDNLQTPASPDAARNWNTLLCNTVRSLDSNHPVTAGLHIEDHDRYINFRTADLALANDYLSMHAYSLYTNWARTALDPAVVGFSVRLAHMLSGKNIMAEEYGICTTPDVGKSRLLPMQMGYRCWQQLLASETEASNYYEQVGELVYSAGAIGAISWCFSDYDPCLYSRAPFDSMIHERYFGLTRHDGSAKPSLVAFLKLKDRAVSVAHPMPIPGDYYADPKGNFTRLFTEYADNIPALQPD